MPLFRPNQTADQNCGRVHAITGEVKTYSYDWDNISCNVIQEEESDRFKYCLDICGDLDLTGATINVDTFSTDLLETEWDTPTGQSIYAGRQVLNGVTTWEYYTIDAAGDPVPYAGARIERVEQQTFELDAC